MPDPRAVEDAPLTDLAARMEDEAEDDAAERRANVGPCTECGSVEERGWADTCRKCWDAFVAFDDDKLERTFDA